MFGMLFAIVFGAGGNGLADAAADDMDLIARAREQQQAIGLPQNVDCDTGEPTSNPFRQCIGGLNPGIVTVLHQQPDKVAQVCRLLGSTAASQAACAARFTDGTCLIVLPDPESVNWASYQTMEDHERMHCMVGEFHERPSVDIGEIKAQIAAN